MSEAADPWRRVSVVTVTHHSAAVIESCLRSVAAAAAILVVDNASSDATLDLVRRTVPAARIIANRRGVGFGNGANQGLAEVRTEFALLINPDAVLRPGALAELLAAADRYPDAAMLAPRVFHPDGHLEFIHNVSLLERPAYAARRDDPAPAGDLCAGYLSGAVNLVRMSALRPQGGYDPRIFLYYEDDDLCIRLRRAGGSLLLVAAAEAEHIGGGSIRRGWDKVWEKFWHMSWSRLYIEQKYRGRSAMLRTALPNLARYAGKTLGNLAILNRTKLVRDAARFSGTLAYLLGLSATRKAPKG